MRQIIIITTICIFSLQLMAQEKSLVNTSKSPYAKLTSVDLTDVVWTSGFWAERFHVCEHSMVPHMMGCYLDDTVSHAFKNFRIAAGLEKGEHFGPAFHDGDFYKMLEGMIMTWSVTRNAETEKEIEYIIGIIAKAQRVDGYIHTPTTIKAMNEPDKKHEFSERLHFETYNMGHLMTAACLHHRLTGKRNLLDVAIGATNFLYNFYKTASTELARNAICPSHYMGVTEMYRTTRDPKYLELAKNLIEIRSLMTNGTDDNQDRLPFKQQTKAVGHSVRANYLYAGAADVYAETGDDSLLIVLDKVWNDVTQNKMYITGGCGALYNGVSPDGTTYDQSPIQQVHQAYGRDYQLPNLTAHNESCANIGNLLWNWRMFLLTGEEKYIDVLETVAYNSLLAAVSLDGTGYFYTNPLTVVHGESEKYRWSKVREPYISYCNCCPPNTIRTIAQIHNYAYSVSEKGLWLNLYGANKLATNLRDGLEVAMNQETDYPWNGRVYTTLTKAPEKEFSIFVRIPQWATKATLKINGKAVSQKINPGSYVELRRTWKAGDIIDLDMPLRVQLVEAIPLVEEVRGQVAVKRGPVVYCIEEVDVPEGQSIFDVSIPGNVKWKMQPMQVGENSFQGLVADLLVTDKRAWSKQLYREAATTYNKIPIVLVPYYAWGNRGKANMSVWIPLSR